MTWYIVRLGRAILTLLLLIAFSFFSLSLSGDPARAKFAEDIDFATLEAFREKWGLNDPLWLQFLHYLDRLLHLDLGTSYATGHPAVELVLARLPVTLSLMLPTILISLAVGIPIGAYAAMHRGRFADRLAIFLAVLTIAVPPFLLGLIFMYVFSVWLGLLSPSGYVDWTSYLLPVATMALPIAAVIARFTRSAMLEVLCHPMLDTAKASGLGRSVIQRVHVLPNALLPLITIIALEFGNLFTHAVVVESVFGWAGTGRLLVDSVAARDFSVVQAVLLLTGTTMIVSNFLADLAYGLVDPRIRDFRRAGRRLWSRA